MFSSDSPHISWSYNDLKPYYKQAEKFAAPAVPSSVSANRKDKLFDDHSDLDSEHRGMDGLWHTSYGYFQVRL